MPRLGLARILVAAAAALTVAPLVTGPTAAAATPAVSAPVPAAARAAAATPAGMHLVFANSYADGVLNSSMRYGRYTDAVRVGDWNADGRDGVLIRRGITYRLRNALSTGAPFASVVWGRPTDESLVGDWDGDGRDTLGLRRGNRFYLRNTLTGDPGRVITFTWGRATDTVLVGDWDGDGRDTLALRRGSTLYYRNTLTGGTAKRVDYGLPGDRPLAGDWNGDGRDSIALRRGRTLRIKNTIAPGRANGIRYWGRAGDRILIGDWNGDGKDRPGAARRADPRYRVWELVNNTRLANGRHSLRYSRCLQRRYAQPWAATMAGPGGFEHQPLARGRCRPDAMAENIAAGYARPADVMRAFMNSPGHRANILAGSRTVIGVGRADSGDAYGRYWVQDFG